MKSLSLAFISFIVTNASLAQLPVKDEPRHHNVFENDFIRILDVHLKPGDTTMYHLHNTPSVFLYFTTTKVGSELINQPASSGVNAGGTIIYDCLKTPRIHRVWNEDTSWFHVMDVEIVNPQPQAKHSFANFTDAELLFDKPQVRGYRVQINEGKTFNSGKSDLRFLLISLDEAPVSVTRNANPEMRVMKPGHFIWVQPNEHVVIKTLNSSQASFALLVLK